MRVTGRRSLRAGGPVELRARAELARALDDCNLHGSGRREEPREATTSNMQAQASPVLLVGRATGWRRDLSNVVIILFIHLIAKLNVYNHQTNCLDLRQTTAAEAAANRQQEANIKRSAGPDDLLRDYIDEEQLSNSRKDLNYLLSNKKAFNLFDTKKMTTKSTIIDADLSLANQANNEEDWLLDWASDLYKSTMSQRGSGHEWLEMLAQQFDHVGHFWLAQLSAGRRAPRGKRQAPTNDSELEVFARPSGNATRSMRIADEAPRRRPRARGQPVRVVTSTPSGLSDSQETSTAMTTPAEVASGGDDDDDYYSQFAASAPKSGQQAADEESTTPMEPQVGPPTSSSGSSTSSTTPAPPAETLLANSLEQTAAQADSSAGEDADSPEQQLADYSLVPTALRAPKRRGSHSKKRLANLEQIPAPERHEQPSQGPSLEQQQQVVADVQALLSRDTHDAYRRDPAAGGGPQLDRLRESLQAATRGQREAAAPYTLAGARQDLLKLQQQQQLGATGLFGQPPLPAGGSLYQETGAPSRGSGWNPTMASQQQQQVASGSRAAPQLVEENFYSQQPAELGQRRARRRPIKASGSRQHPRLATATSSALDQLSGALAGPPLRHDHSSLGEQQLHNQPVYGILGASNGLKQVQQILHQPTGLSSLQKLGYASSNLPTLQQHSPAGPSRRGPLSPTSSGGGGHLFPAGQQALQRFGSLLLPGQLFGAHSLGPKSASNTRRQMASRSGGQRLVRVSTIQQQQQQQGQFDDQSGSNSATGSAGSAATSDPIWSDTQNQEEDYQQSPQTIQITAVPNGLVGNGLGGAWNGWNGAWNGAWNGLGPWNGRQVLLVNRQPQVGSSGPEWRQWALPVAVVLALPLVLGALFVPVFLKSVMFLIQILQMLGLLMPPHQLAGHLASSAHSSSSG